MIQALATAECLIPPAVEEAVKASVENTASAFFSVPPRLVGSRSEAYTGPCIAGIISFLGEVSWSLSWVLTEQTAPAIAQRFCGFEIPFDSADMGDMAGELVNVIAGEIISQLERRSLKSQMSLPTICRGNPLELVPEFGPGIVQLDYESQEGPFWLRLASARNRTIRIPGR